MLIIRDGICYVDSENLTRYPIPSTVVLDKTVYEKNDYARFFDPITILYFKAREDMLDYDEISILSEVELDTLIYQMRVKLNKISEDFLKETIDRRNALLKNEHYRNGYKNLEYKYNELKSYKSNREEYDSNIRKITKSMTKTKVK